MFSGFSLSFSIFILFLLNSALGIRQICSGESYVCVLTLNYSVHCEGDNTYGQLGSSSFYVPINTSVIEISCGNKHVCAVTGNYQLYCWGDNSYGQLGQGNTQTYFTPQLVATNSSIILRLATGNATTCVINSNSQVVCYGKLWGYDSNNYYGLGSGENIPLAVNLNQSIFDISLGNEYACAVTYSEKYICWGLNILGQLGTGDNTSIGDASNPMPPSIQSLSFLTQRISCCGSTCCSFDQSSNVTCWGSNSNGQIYGYPGTSYGDAYNEIPLSYKLPFNVSYVYVGENWACGKINSSIMCWGSIAKSLTVLNDAIQIAPITSRGDTFWGYFSGGIKYFQNGTLSSPVKLLCGNGVYEPQYNEYCDGTANCTSNCTLLCLTLQPLGSTCNNGIWSEGSVTVDGTLTLSNDTQINGNLTLTSSSIIVIANPLTIHVNGSTTLNGELVLGTGNSSFVLLNADSVSGQFSKVTSNDCSSVTYTHTSVLIEYNSCGSKKSTGINTKLVVGLTVGIFGAVVIIIIIGAILIRKRRNLLIFRADNE